MSVVSMALAAWVGNNREDATAAPPPKMDPSASRRDEEAGWVESPSQMDGICTEQTRAVAAMATTVDFRLVVRTILVFCIGDSMLCNRIQTLGNMSISLYLCYLDMIWKGCS